MPLSRSTLLALSLLTGTALPARAIEPPRAMAAPAEKAPQPALLPAPAPTGSFALPEDRAAEPKGTAATAPKAEAPAVPSPPASPPAPTAETAGPPAPKPKPPAPPAVARVSNDPRPTLTPETFIATLRAAERHQAIADAGGWPSLPAGPPLKLGDKGAAVALLKQRLRAMEDLEVEALPGETFDARVLAAVKRFQARHGLPETGLVGPKTVEAMNVPAATRQRQLAASAQRLIGSHFAFGERYVVVNVPSATVEAVDKGQVARRYVAVVGKKDRATPAVETRITNINLNPTWTVPVSIIRKDIIPQMRKDPGYLAKMKIRILDGQGAEIDPVKIDWSTQRAVNYTLRQDAGTANSLGQVRIDMPNRHAVYLHDTPTKRLFAQEARFHSSGCVRVADVKAFVEWLLDGTPNAAGAAWSRLDLESAIATGQRHDIRLAKPVPVAFVYLTGYATPDGTAHFRDDVYGLDTGEPAPAATPPRGDDLVTSSITPLPPRRAF